MACGWADVCGIWAGEVTVRCGVGCVVGVCVCRVECCSGVCGVERGVQPCECAAGVPCNSLNMKMETIENADQR